MQTVPFCKLPPGLRRRRPQKPMNDSTPILRTNLDVPAPTLRRSRRLRDLQLLALLFAASFAIAQAHASIGVSLQMQLGNPSGATADTNNHNHYLVQRTVEALDFSDNLGEPNWASWDLTSTDVGSSGRSSSFYTDTTLPSNFYHVSTSDYTSSGFDRGHMC